MVNKIINGIAGKLDIFELPIYSEEVKQGFSEPCFFIFPLEISITKVVMNRYHANHSFDVHYFPSDNESMNDMSQQLFDLLEYIETEQGLLRGTDMHCERADGVLHFFVSYNLHTYKDIAKEAAMNGVTVNNGLKEG